MQQLPRVDDENLLVGPEHFSDAGVYRVSDGCAMVQSVDFFAFDPAEVQYGGSIAGAGPTVE